MDYCSSLHLRQGPSAGIIRGPQVLDSSTVSQLLAATVSVTGSLGPQVLVQEALVARRQHTHTSAYVSIRTSAYVSIARVARPLWSLCATERKGDREQLNKPERCTLNE
jgi:hypothetical protein